MDPKLAYHGGRTFLFQLAGALGVDTTSYDELRYPVVRLNAICADISSK